MSLHTCLFHEPTKQNWVCSQGMGEPMSSKGTGHLWIVQLWFALRTLQLQTLPETRLVAGFLVDSNSFLGLGTPLVFFQDFQRLIRALACCSNWSTVGSYRSPLKRYRFGYPWCVWAKIHGNMMKHGQSLDISVLKPVCQSCVIWTLSGQPSLIVAWEELPVNWNCWGKAQKTVRQLDN